MFGLHCSSWVGSNLHTTLIAPIHLALTDLSLDILAHENIPLRISRLTFLGRTILLLANFAVMLDSDGGVADGGTMRLLLVCTFAGVVLAGVSLT